MTGLRRHRRTVPSVLAGLVLALSLSGCGSEDGTSRTNGDPARNPSNTPGTEASPTPTEDPETGDDASETPAAPPTGPAVGSAEDLLLDTAQMPGLNEATTWVAGDGPDPSTEALGLCQKASLLDIGAQEVASVHYATDGGTATQVVATTADTKSTERLHDVLLTWHEECAATIGAGEVGELMDVDTEHGTAQAYVVHTGTPGQDADATWQSVAINTHDTWVSLVVIESQGQDYNYAAGQTPAEQAAAAVSAKIG